METGRSYNYSKRRKLTGKEENRNGCFALAPLGILPPLAASGVPVSRYRAAASTALKIIDALPKYSIFKDIRTSRIF